MAAERTQSLDALPKLQIRSKDFKTKKKWDAALEDLLWSLEYPNFFTEDPPSEEQATSQGYAASHPGLQEALAKAVSTWWQVNDTLHKAIEASLDLDSIHFDRDFEIVRSFKEYGKYAAVPLLAWVNSCFDLSSADEQSRLSGIIERKIGANEDYDAFSIHCSGKYAAWTKIVGNDSAHPLAFFRKLLTSMPTAPVSSPIVMTRTYSGTQGIRNGGYKKRRRGLR